MTSQSNTPPTLMTAEELSIAVKGDLPAALRDFLPRQRWFGAKDLAVTDVSIDDLSVSPSGELWHMMVVASMTVASGDALRYLVPLVAIPGGPATGSNVLAIETRSGRWSLVDAFTVPAFLSWLLGQVAAGAVWPTEQGQFRWAIEGAMDQYLAAAYTGPSKVGTAEQSNTAVTFGDALFFKLFRRLRLGENPDEEISRFLSQETTFRHLPRLMATGHYETQYAPEVGIGIVQTFVPSMGDGWSWMLRHLANLKTLSEDNPGIIAAALLGTRTAELHRALASAPETSNFHAEGISSSDTDSWTRETANALDDVWRSLLVDRHRLSPQIVELIDAVGPHVSALRDIPAGHIDLIDHLKIRVHGDYHLGQTLRTLSDDWTILDFEGEPARTIDERRTKTSPLKDVAGMLRSFAYARATAGQSRSSGDGAVLDQWQRAARSAFLAAYRVAASETPGLVPADDGAFARALAAWELDKAIYELRYEMRNRPDWLGIPLSTLVDLSHSR